VIERSPASHSARALYEAEPTTNDLNLTSAYAELNLLAFKHNLQRVRVYAPQSRIMAVIKANGYGHGLVRVARALSGVDAFAVARVSEGIALRQAGIRQRIIVLQGFFRSEELVLHARHDLEPVIHSVFQVDLIESAAFTESLAVWLKLDTGMHRLGLDESEFAACYQRLKRCARVRPRIPVMTHLASADNLADPATVLQLALFDRIAAQSGHERSFANSAALLGWKEAAADWVRPGIMLYGASPFASLNGADHGLKPVMTLKTRLIASKQLKPGDAVGYGGDWVCQRPSRLGIAAAGYGDGYPRSAKSGTPVLVHGQRVPLVGRVSMDMISIDLTGCPEAQIGDTVTLWGEGLPVEEVARHASTIPYALLCGVTPRVRVLERA
jgi:alanine racemase